MKVNDAYDQMANSGLYSKPPGLKGKYDNVRRFWEDEVTASYLRPYLEHIRRTNAARGKKIRIMDLGCGSGDGFELLTSVTKHDASPRELQVNVLPEEEVGLYLGLDLNSQLLDQGKAYYGRNGKVQFRKGDFLQDLGVEDETPFDIYMANYGTFSHCRDKEAEQLLVNIARHGKKRSLIIADWLGGYSYEWQDLWMDPLETDYMIPYVVSYLYDEEERKKLDLEKFDLRLMERKTLVSLVERAARRCKVEMKVLRMFDRSMMVGRHIETGDYNPNPQPLRTTINSLLEPGCRTDLEQLQLSYYPRKGFDTLNHRFQRLEKLWNSLVEACIILLEGKPVPSILIESVGEEEEFLSLSIKTLHQLLEQTANLPVEDVRANIFEPQLAYILRRAEMLLQEGMGMGHGLTAIIEINNQAGVE